MEECRAAFSDNGSKGFPSALFNKAKDSGVKIVGNCSACEVEFISRSQMALHQKSVHKSTIQYSNTTEMARDLSKISWRKVFDGSNNREGSN